MDNIFLSKNKIFNSLKKTKCFDIIKNKNSIFLVALSGGIDSMCLIDIFFDLQKEYGFKLYAMHINHNIRKESNRDLEFVSNYCRHKKIEFFYKNVDVINYAKQNKLSIEEAARILRYKMLEDKKNELSDLEKNKNIYIITAHHKNDQAETIIHNLIRGTGITGLIGIRDINGNYLRPFINTEKKYIDEYVKIHNVPYVVDDTNFDIKYTRNFIRHKIFEDFKIVNSEAINHICDISFFLKEIDDFFNDYLKNIINSIIICELNKIIIDCKIFNTYKNILKYYIIKFVFERIGVENKNITKKNIDDILNLSIGFNNKHLDLPYNLTVDKKNNKLFFVKHNKNFSMLHKKKV